jgi:choline dehydrogenase-like flavoprotein
VSDERRVVVVGSGPPGATAAATLSRAGIDVTLLEAGLERAASGLTARIGGVTVARFHRPLRERTGDVTRTADRNALLFEDLAPGGLSNHWSCAVPRFSPEDFADAERAGPEFTWPIGYDDLAPWYDRVEPLLHIAGSGAADAHVPAGRIRHAWALNRSWAAVADTARADGRSVLALPYAYGAATTLTRTGTVFNSFVRVVRPALRSGHLEVRFGARVLHLAWSPTKRRVEAVVYRDAVTGAEQRVPCRAVVLAAGAVQTARILLESTSADFPEGLGNSQGVLGRYLHDHPLGKIVLDLSDPLGMRPPAYISRPTLERSAPLLAAAYVQWSSVRSLVQSVVSGHPLRLPWAGFTIFGTMPPSREHRIALAPGRRSDDGTAAIELHISHPPESRKLLEAERAWVTEALTRAGLHPRPRQWESPPAGASCHYGGTCRMHASPRYGMLDRWNRLHQVPNVRVVDSAAFTTGPEKNPVLTAMAIAARAADHLATTLRGGDA